MVQKNLKMGQKKKIALVAHDNTDEIRMAYETKKEEGKEEPNLTL